MRIDRAVVTRQHALPAPHAALNGSLDERMLAALRETFGYTEFRPLQAQIVRAILERQDVFVLMPTGGGKSLCYQLPALLLDGMTVVVSPLIALMKDQVDALRALGVAATYINSSLEPAEIRRRQASVLRGEVKLLYVAPERLMMHSFLNLLSNVPPVLFAIDEAHCISEWGHDFRPEYRELRRLRDLFPDATLGAFTATATPRVRADIRHQLGLEAAGVFQGSFNRTNLYYDVRPKQASYEQLFDYLTAHPDVSGIIYCQARNATEQLAERLRGDGFDARAYHAGLDASERDAVQEAFVNDDVRIIVATIAFGMGIDKPDVRFVVHFDLPRNLEGYYQESGRAGRDGEPADCILFYSYGDVAKHQHFIEQKESPSERRVAQAQLRAVTDWAAGVTCRRKALLAYFHEEYDGRQERCCDVCSGTRELVDSTIPAQMFLSCVKRTGERFGSAYVIDVLRGSKAERILRFGHDRLSTWGIGHDRPKEEWQHIARYLLMGGYATQDPEDYNAVRVTERGHAVLFKGERVMLPAPPKRAGKGAERGRATADTTEFHGPLFQELRALRKRIADARDVPPYVIFPDTVLRQMAAQLPRSREDLLRIHGVGQHKAQEFGARFIACILEYVERTGATPFVQRAVDAPSPSPAPRPRPVGLTPSPRVTLDLFREGKSVEEIAAERQLSPRTVEGHLVEAIEAGEMFDIDRVVDREKREAIEQALREVGDATLRPVIEHLGDGYSYFELNVVRALARRGAGAPSG